MVVMRDYLPSFFDSSPEGLSPPTLAVYGEAGLLFFWPAGRLCSILCRCRDQQLINFVSLYRLAPFCFFVSANILYILYGVQSHYSFLLILVPFFSSRLYQNQVQVQVFFLSITAKTKSENRKQYRIIQKALLPSRGQNTTESKMEI